MKKIATIGVVIVVILVTNFWSYKIGNSRANTWEAVKYMVVVKEQNACIENNDINCAKGVNALMSAAVAGQLERLDKSGLSEVDKREISEFLEWQKTVNVLEIVKSNKSLKEADALKRAP